MESSEFEKSSEFESFLAGLTKEEARMLLKSLKNKPGKKIFKTQKIVNVNHHCELCGAEYTTRKEVTVNVGCEANEIAIKQKGCVMCYERLMERPQSEVVEMLVYLAGHGYLPKKGE